MHSQFERYIDTIRLLAQKGPLKLTLSNNNANPNCSVLKEDLGFLVIQGLVEERNIGKAKKVFTITQQGINVLKYFQEFKQTLPIVKKARTQAIPTHKLSIPSIAIK